ncbi:hypothetical protein [Sphingobacterium corticibacterium]|uniref:hypothetical protein n=1 Tax=Sphingobacterium corticibacterium TaxID=2484746 RepID=UPI0019CF5111|nr:hypothetical protein [Sphingobacterium corticibacterium]
MRKYPLNKILEFEDNRILLPIKVDQSGENMIEIVPHRAKAGCLVLKKRNKAKHANDFQHNILKNLHNPPAQYAFYVEPLTLSIKEYNDLLDVTIFNRFFNFHPIDYEDLNIRSGILKYKLGLIPYLRAHVSIPPHEDVTSSDHYYSYTKGGTNIACHSGTIIPEDYRLSTQFENILDQAYNERYMVNQNQYLEMIDTIIQEPSKNSNYYYILNK